MTNKNDTFDLTEFLAKYPWLFKLDERPEDGDFLFIAKRENFPGRSAQEVFGLTDRECKQLRGAIHMADDPANQDSNAIFKPLGILRADIVNNDYRLKTWVAALKKSAV